MRYINYTIEFVANSLIAQYFLMGALGSLMFSVQSYFKKDVGLSQRRKNKHSSARFNIVYITFQSFSSAIMGGLLGLWLDHNLWLSFIAGFLSDSFLTFVVKTLEAQALQKSFWLGVARALFSVVGQPLKKVLSLLEVLSTTKNDNETDK